MPSHDESIVANTFRATREGDLDSGVTIGEESLSLKEDGFQTRSGTRRSMKTNRACANDSMNCYNAKNYETRGVVAGDDRLAPRRLAIAFSMSRLSASDS